MQTRSRIVEMPSGLSLPLAFGMNTRLIGSGRYVSRLDPIRFDVREVLAVHARCALVGTALGVSMSQNIRTADLVVQGVEAITGFCLRFRV